MTVSDNVVSIMAADGIELPSTLQGIKVLIFISDAFFYYMIKEIYIC